MFMNTGQIHIYLLVRLQVLIKKIIFGLVNATIAQTLMKEVIQF